MPVRLCELLLNLSEFSRSLGRMDGADSTRSLFGGINAIPIQN